MTEDKVKPMVLWVMTRVFVLYLIVCGVLLLTVNSVRLTTKTINFYSPASMDYLRDLENGKAIPDPIQLKKFRKYFEIVNRYCSSTPFSLGILGMIHYYMGDLTRSAAYYKKAMRLYPYYLNYYYNSVLVNLTKPDYSPSVDSLADALQTIKPQQCMTLIRFSQSELKRFISKDVFDQTYDVRVKADYRDAVFLLLASLIYTDNARRAAGLLQQVIQVDGDDRRYRCLDEYITYIYGRSSQQSSVAIQSCRQELGWMDPGTAMNSISDPFNLKKIRLKIW